MAKNPDYSSIRIFASPTGAVVQDANRKAIQGIFGVDIAIRPARPPILRLNMICGHFDAAGTPLFAVADPADGMPRPVRRIEFADGGVFEAPPLPAAAVGAATGNIDPPATEPQTPAPQANGNAAPANDELKESGGVD